MTLSCLFLKADADLCVSERGADAPVSLDQTLRSCDGDGLYENPLPLLTLVVLLFTLRMDKRAQFLVSVTSNVSRFTTSPELKW